MTAPANLLGLRFGRLSVAERQANDRHGRTKWLCQCDCGASNIVSGGSLISGRTTSCGCLHTEVIRTQRPRLDHGHASGTRTPEYRAWRGMITRCNDLENENYGGRGIFVCARWRNDFSAFLEDVGPRPSEGHSLDREDPDGNYEPDNVRWATTLEQAQNRRNVLHVIYQGNRIALSAAVRLAGCLVSLAAARDRIKRGWSVDAAVGTRKYTRPSTEIMKSTNQTQEQAHAW